MNDAYLKSFKKSPNLQLIERIYTRLEKRERRQRLKRYSFLSVLALTFVFGMLMIFSSSVRAEVMSMIVKFGGLQFEVTSNVPLNPNIPSIELVPEYLSWEAARNRFVAPLQLPTYVPDGYKREADTMLTIWSDNTPTLEVIWRKKGQFPMIVLFIAQCRSDDQGCGFAVGEDALEEIMLNGRPAALFRGSWNVDTQQYERSSMVSIVWRYDENTFYKLWSFDQKLTDELIRMAESVP